MFVLDDRYDIDAFNYFGFVGSPKYFLVIDDSLFSNGIVNILHPKVPSLIDYFLFDNFTMQILFFLHYDYQKI